MSVPRLRFPEFSEVWEEQRLADICKINPNSGRLPEKFIYIDLESVENGVLLKENYINLSDAPSRAQRLLNKDDILFQTVRPYQKNNFYFDKVDIRFQYVASTGYAQLRTYEDSKFLYQYLHTQKFVDSILEKCTGTSYPAINSSDLSKIIIYKPSLEEQQKIGDFFMLLDKRIEQQEEKIALLKDYKKAMIQRIFSQKIRFKDQNGNDYPDWEEKKLGEMIYRSSKKNTDQKYDRIQSISNKYGFVNQEDYFQDRRVGSLNVSNYYVINKGCFAYNPSRIDVGSLAYKHDNDISIISPLYVSFKGNTKHINDKFLLGWLFSHKFVGKLGRLFEGSVRNTLSYENLSTIDIETPCIAEQEKIALFLEVINDSIENQKELLDEIIKEKTALLNRMFI